VKELAPPPSEGQGAGAVPDWVYVVGAVLALAPSVFLVWFCGRAAIETGRARRWHLAAAAPIAALPLLAIKPAMVAGWVVASYGPLGAAQPLRVGWDLVLTLLGVLGRLVVVSLPVGVPVGLAAAALRTSQPADVVLAEDSNPKVRAVRADARARRQRIVGKLTSRTGRLAGQALGESQGGDLSRWQQGGYVIPPTGQFGLTMILVGASGTGKSKTIERVAYLLGQERRELCLIDGKGTDDLDQAVTAAYLTGWQCSGDDLPRVGCFPQQPVDIWRLHGQQPATVQQMANRLAAAWLFSDEAEFFEQIAEEAIRLALAQPGPPCTSMVELIRRLDPPTLASAWAGHPVEVSVIRGLEKKERLTEVSLRAGNLAAALAGGWDGGWWLGDVDLACFTVPTLDNPKDSDKAMRVLLSAYGQYLVNAPRRPRMLAFDEFSALGGGRAYAIHLVERARSSGSGVLLGAQSAAGLGDQRDRERLLASSDAQILFRSPIPAELSMLAGTQDALAVTRSAGAHDERVSVAERHVGKVDQQEVREAETGVGEVISRGRKVKVKVSLNKIDPAILDQARELTADHRPALPVSSAHGPTLPSAPSPQIRRLEP
jgi:hypothetical protein